MRDPRKESKSGRRKKVIESCTEFIHTMLYYKQFFFNVYWSKMYSKTELEFIFFNQISGTKDHPI